MAAPYPAPKPPVGDWANLGNCVGLPSSWFFPERGETGGGRNEVKAVCASCCVRAECLEYALAAPVERTGVWGGTSFKDRLRILRERRPA